MYIQFESSNVIKTTTNNKTCTYIYVYMYIESMTNKYTYINVAQLHVARVDKMEGKELKSDR